MRRATDLKRSSMMMMAVMSILIINLFISTISAWEPMTIFHPSNIVESDDSQSYRYDYNDGSRHGEYHHREEKDFTSGKEENRKREKKEAKETSEEKEEEILEMMDNTCQYGIIELLSLSILCAMTIYRREMSSNRVYLHSTTSSSHHNNLGKAEWEKKQWQQSKRRRQRRDRNSVRSVEDSKDITASSLSCMEDDFSEIKGELLQAPAREEYSYDLDAVLDGAAYVYSGGPLLSVLLAVWAHILFTRFSHMKPSSTAASKGTNTSHDSNSSTARSTNYHSKSVTDTEPKTNSKNDTLPSSDQANDPVEQKCKDQCEKGSSQHIVCNHNFSETNAIETNETSSPEKPTFDQLYDETRTLPLPSQNHQAIKSVAWNAAKEWMFATTGGGGARYRNDNTSQSSLSPLRRPRLSHFASSPLSQTETLTTPNHHNNHEGWSRLLHLPTDTQIHIVSYLHPKDVLTLCCVNRHLQRLLDDQHSSVTTKTSENRGDDNDSSGSSTNIASLIWLTLWRRDYEWILNQWSIGRKASRRSFDHNATLLNDSAISNGIIIASSDFICPPMVTSSLWSDFQTSINTKRIASDKYISMKEFYFLFSQTWLNYTIAGEATESSCHIGLHGHVFNITNFLVSHPGSPETLLMQGAGRDATAFFESVGHSLSARQMATRAREISIPVVDLSCYFSFDSDSSLTLQNNSHDDNQCKNFRYANEKVRQDHQQWGLVSCGYLRDDADCNNSLLSYSSPLIDGLLPRTRSKPRKPGTMHAIRKKLHDEELKAKLRAKNYSKKILSCSGGNDTVAPVTPVYVFYDPLCSKWMGWYLNINFNAVFVPNL